MTGRRALAALAAVSLVTTTAAAQVVARKAALSTAHPLATRAALSLLQRGGSAADAAVTAAFVLAVAHPQAGNLGGGGFVVYYDRATRGVWTLDFRETAPRALTAAMLEKAKGSDAARALSAGVPSTVAGLDALHRKFGTKPWNELLAPAIALAAEGPRSDAEIATDAADAKSGRNLTIPTELPPPALHATLTRLAEAGARDFYRGALAESLVSDVRNAGGVIGFRDLREYEPQWRAPLKMTYGAYEIYAPPPPSSGGLIIGGALNILSAYDVANLDTVSSLHVLLEAQRRASLDAIRYVGDPAGARLPLRELLSLERADLWRKTLDTTRASATSALADPGSVTAGGVSTTHFTIVDEQGNIASLTTSLGNPFGSGLLLPSLGFFLNESALDFTSHVNALAPLKRPASTMTPLIVLREGRPFLAAGTRGGAAGPTTLLQLFLRVVVSGNDLAAAVAAPRYHQGALPDIVHYEERRADPKVIEALNAMGHPVTARPFIGDVHAILFVGDRLTAVADPRRVGSAGGY